MVLVGRSILGAMYLRTSGEAELENRKHGQPKEDKESDSKKELQHQQQYVSLDTYLPTYPNS